MGVNPILNRWNPNVQPNVKIRSKKPRLAMIVSSLFVIASCSNQAAETPPTSEPAPPSTSESTPPSTDSEPAVGAWAKENYELLPIAGVDEPTAAVSRPNSAALWVAERPGVVRVIELEDVEEADDPSTPITIQAPDDTVLDISDRVGTEGEGGLLGIAFSPDGNRLYVSYTNNDQNSVISEFEMSGDRAEGDERILLEVVQPFSNHNGGDITFGPDGLLYIGLGDGGSGGDPEANGQNLSTLLGSMLRIDPTPTDEAPYTTPTDNPFTELNNPTETENARPEIWAYGLRNPWRFSFDAETGDLWIGDVGQNRFEEINFLPAAEQEGGANLGWNAFEANESFEGNPEPDDHHRPIFTYETDQDQCSVIGGFAYRGQAIEALSGVYLYSDFCSGSIAGIEQQDGEVVADSPLTFNRELEQVVSFGQGPAGEIYVLEQGGQISRIVLLDSGGDGGSIT